MAWIRRKVRRHESAGDCARRREEPSTELERPSTTFDTMICEDFDHHYVAELYRRAERR
ncbi:MAG: hypothetical protein JO362_05680 [Streptomycetaceae bacterium]|nr:hypothetical protein [Streptomycetaceae bacterium]